MSITETNEDGVGLPRQRDGPDGEPRQPRQDPHQPQQGRDPDVHQALPDHRQGQEGIRLHQRH